MAKKIIGLLTVASLLGTGYTLGLAGQQSVLINELETLGATEEDLSDFKTIRNRNLLFAGVLGLTSVVLWRRGIK